MTETIQGREKASSSYFKMMIAVVFILLLAWFLQLHQLQTNSLWADEVASYDRAMMTSWSDVHQEYLQSGHTPLYEWIVLRSWLHLVGGGNILSRIPTLFISTLVLALTYTLSRRVTTHKVAITAVFLTAISPLVVEHAREVRPYLLMSLTSMIALYMWLRALQTERWKYWIGFTIGGGLMIYTHYYGFIVLIAIGLVTLVHIWHTKSVHLLRPFSISALVIAILFLPWMPTFLTAYKNDNIGWIGPLTKVQVYFLPTTFVNHMRAPQHISAGSGSLMVALILWILATMARLQPKWLPRLVGISFLTIALSIIVSLTMKPMFIARYFMGVVPIFALMLSWGLWHLQPKWLVGMIYAPLLILMLSGSKQLVTLQRESPWQSAIAYVQENDEPTDVFLVVSTETWTIRSFFHNCQECEIPIYSVVGSLKNQEQVEAWVEQYNQYDRIWFVGATRNMPLQPQSTYSGYALQERKSFDQDLISPYLALDLWLLAAE